jgi:hypothetical protein
MLRGLVFVTRSQNTKYNQNIFENMEHSKYLAVTIINQYLDSLGTPPEITKN